MALQKIKGWVQNFLATQLAEIISKDVVQYLYINPGQVVLIITSSTTLMDAFETLSTDETYRKQFEGMSFSIVLDEEPGKTTVLLKYDN